MPITRMSDLWIASIGDWRPGDLWMGNLIEILKSGR